MQNIEETYPTAFQEVHQLERTRLHVQVHGDPQVCVQVRPGTFQMWTRGEPRKAEGQSYKQVEEKILPF